MCKKGNLTREEAVAIVGEAAVAKVDRASCDFTNRAGYNGLRQGADEVEFAASVACKAEADLQVSLAIYYYQNARLVEEKDLEDLDWYVEGYEIV